MKNYIKSINRFYKKISNIIICLISFMGVFGILYINKIVNGSTYGVYNNPLNIIIYFLIFYSYKNINKDITLDKNTIFSSAFSVIFSSIIVIGTQLEYLTQILFEFKTIIAIIFLTFDVFIVVYLLLKKVNKISLKCSEISERKITIIGYSIIFLSTFLVFLAIYPGIYGYDSIYQLQSGLGLQETTEHYSVIYIYMISFVFLFGKFVSGNYQLGCAIQIIIQMVFLTYVANKVCIYVYKTTKNIKLWIFSIIFFSGFTFYKIMVVSIAQDTIFTGFFVLFFLRIINLVTNNEVKKLSYFIMMGIDVLGICLFRNNGFYALLLIIPFMYFIDKNKKNKIILFSAIIIPMVIYKLITSYVYPSIGIVKNTDSLKEMSSVPSQQFGRVLLKNQSVYCLEDIERLKFYYFDIEALEKACVHNPCIADLQKKQLNSQKVDEDKFGYIKLWIKIGITDTKNYIEAFLYNNLGLWYPNKNYPDRRMYHPLIEYENIDTEEYNKYHNTNYEVIIKRESKFPIYEKVLKNYIKEELKLELIKCKGLAKLNGYFLEKAISPKQRL